MEVERVMDGPYVWVVVQQLPCIRIRGLFRGYEAAKAKHEAIPDEQSPIIYPCEEYMLRRQAGYRTDLRIR